jgi:tetratricopeptide (TPR) repeat protein
MSSDLAHSIKAHAFAGQGRLEEALRELETAPRLVPFSRRAASWAFTQPQDRFLRAELLLTLGKPEDALKWYESIHYWPESVLAGPSHLRQAEIHETLGRRTEAAAQYRRVVNLWRECDPEFRPLLLRAEEAIQRLGRQAPSVERAR